MKRERDRARFPALYREITTVIQRCLNDEAERVRQQVRELRPLPHHSTDVHPDTLRGRYLCEGCGAAMTDEIVPASESPTGEEMALCALCQVRGV